MIENLQLVIFDMDGLMFDTERLAHEGTVAAFKELNIAIDEDILKTAIGQYKFDRRKYIIGEIPDGLDINSFMIDFMTKRRAKILAQGIPKKPGLDNLLALCKKLGLKIAVGTSTPLDRTMQYLENAGLADSFDCIVSGDQVANGKPWPDIFLTACQRLQVPVENALVLEDSINGALAAFKADIKCIIVPDIIYPYPEICNIVYAVAASLDVVAAMIAEGR